MDKSGTRKDSDNCSLPSFPAFENDHQELRMSACQAIFHPFSEGVHRGLYYFQKSFLQRVIFEVGVFYKEGQFSFL